MPHLFLQPQHIGVEAEGTFWVPLIYGDQRADGTWIAWIEFRPLDDRELRVTERETTQPNREAVAYWATGLEPVYFEGAFARAMEVQA